MSRPSIAVFALVLILSAAASLRAQPSSTASLTNGNMEAADESNKPAGWHFVAQPADKQTIALESAEPFEGDLAALLDCSDGDNRFTNLMQSFAADDFRGARVRFRAAVRTAELDIGTRVQLWFRVDRGTDMGSFDNMQDRPIDSDAWDEYEIVLDVAEDATKLNVGMFVIGSGKVWIDDAIVEVVDESVATTSMVDGGALGAASRAPTQPFFTHWLWLVAIALALFALSQTGVRKRDDENDEIANVEPRPSGWLPKFALRFSVAYWLLYSLPTPFTSLAPDFMAPVFRSYAAASEVVIRWSARSLLGIERELVLPGGSGDTTYSYVNVFVCFTLALIIATIWSGLDWRQTNYRIAKDLLRSYLRYVLIVTMLGYGLAKVGDAMNQFPAPGPGRLARTYGESSPMGLLWTFMGASRPYTVFSGLCEVVGGLLLLFRRTTTLGALVLAAVMTNVVLLNFCYDVPVKQYSFHLLVMAIFLLLPDFGRLSAFLVLNRSVPSVERQPPYTGPTSVWIQRAVKLALVGMLAIMPIYRHVNREIKHARSAPAAESTSDDSLLMNRGFRWVNEVPFNR